MALTVTTLQTLLDSLISARARGTLSVRDQNGEMLVYKDDSSMARAIADLEARIAALQVGTVNVIKFNTKKGI